MLFGFIVWLILMTGLVLVPLLLAARRRRLARERNQLIADILGGEAVDGAIRFERQGIPCMFVAWTAYGSRTISTIDAKVGLPAHFEARSVKLVMPPEPVSYGHPLDWDLKGLRIVASDPEWARTARSAGLPELLQELKVWASVPILIHGSPAGLTIRVEAKLRPDRVAALAEFVDRFLAILRRGERETGVRLLEASVDPRQGKCPVCMDPISSPQVACSRCRAPHHAQCWTYNERCGIFGCGSRETR